MVNLDEAYENDIGWPTEIILAKLIKWPEINIFAKLTQMLITCVFTSFHKTWKRIHVSKNSIKKPLLNKKDKNILKPFIYNNHSFIYGLSNGENMLP